MASTKAHRHQVSVRVLETFGRAYNLRYDYYLHERWAVWGAFDYTFDRRDPGAQLLEGFVPNRPATLVAFKKPVAALGARRYFLKQESPGHFFLEGALTATLPYQTEEDFRAKQSEIAGVDLPDRTEFFWSPGARLAFGYQYALPHNFIVAAQVGLDYRRMYTRSIYSTVIGVNDRKDNMNDFSWRGAATSFLVVGKRF